MTEDEAKFIAEKIILEWNDQYEYSLVYEDELLEDYEEEWKRIYDLMNSAKITVTWE